MAKVMISMPDRVLRRLDAHARRVGSTRSGFLRDLVERELDATSDSRSTEVRRLLGRPGRHGGTATEAVRELRRSR